MAATKEAPTRNARVVAVLCQLWCWLGPLLVLSLVVRLTSARTDPFLRQVTGQVLNLQIALAASTALCVIFVALGWNLLAAISWLVFLIIAIYGYTVGLMGAWKSAHGIEWAYPLNLRVVSS